MVEVGFTPPEVTQILPSTMNRFFTSWQRPHSLTTEHSGSVPMRAVPSRCQPAIQDRALDANVAGAGSGENLLRPRDAVLHHLQVVRADRVIDPRRRDAAGVLQHGIERYAIVLLGEVLADRRKTDAMIQELAIDPVMVFAPGQPPRLRTDDRFEDRTDAAAELKSVAAHEIAPRVGLVEFLAPQT